MRRSLIRYVVRQYVGSRRVAKMFNRRGFGSLFDAYSSYKNVTNGHLDQNLWEQNSAEVIENQISKAGNPGQETLLGPEYFEKSAKEFCRTVTKDYNPERFVSYVRADLGDTYYYAINEIIDECAEELLEAWDSSYGGDGLGEKLFGVYQGGSNRVYGSFANAVANYSARATARYGSNWNTNAAANARSAATARKFLAANPRGTARTSFVSAQYRAAAARNGKNL